jgi:hypothetical protein
MSRSRPCRICRHWFQPDARVVDRQRVCSSPKCQAERRKQTQVSWRKHNPDYFTARRLKERAARVTRSPPSSPAAASSSPAPSPASSSMPLVAPPVVRVPPPLDRLPWDVAQDEFGVQGADFIAVFGRLLLGVAQDQRPRQVLDSS